MSTQSDVTGLIANAQGYAAQTLASAISEMSEAMNILQQLQPTGAHFPNLALSIADPLDPGTVPAYTGSKYEAGTFTGLPPNLTQVQQFYLPPDPPDPLPDIPYQAPAQPSAWFNESIIGSPPVLQPLPPFPVMPDLEGEIEGIVAPTITQIEIPAAPTYQPPAFLGQQPTFDATPPANLDVMLKSNYATMNPVMTAAITQQMNDFIAANFPNFAPGMAQIESALAGYLNGGSALTFTPDVEDAIIGRALSHNNQEARRQKDTLLGEAARAGQVMFSPTLQSALQDLDQARRDNNVKTVAELVIKQAELAQNNLQFAITATTQLRSIAMSSALQYYGGLVQINGQAIQMAVQIVDAVIKAFDVAAKYAEVQARLYEAEAEIYKAKVQGALAVLQAYEATVRGLEAQANVDRALVDAYRARIDAVQAEANVYRAAVDAVVAQANLSRIQVELFQAKVNAFGAEVNAYVAQWQGYKAAVDGQVAQQEVNVEHYKKYTAQWEGYTAKVAGLVANVKGQLEINDQLERVYESQIRAFAALEHSKVEGVQVEVEGYRATTYAYQAYAQAVAENSRALIAKAEVMLRGLIAEAEIDMEELREINRINVTRITETARVAVGAGQIYSGIAMSALSGMNTLAAETVAAST